MKTTCPIALATLLSLVFAASTHAAMFVDGFEGATIDPAWTRFETLATASTSTAQAHSGLQSLQFTSNGGPGSGIQLVYELPSLGYGRAEVWYYDTGADVSSSRYAYFSIDDRTSGKSAYLSAWDYDISLSNGGSYVFGITDRIAAEHTLIDRTLDWHHWVLDSQPDALQILVDGNLVYSGPGGLPFDAISLQQFGPEFRPEWTAYYDDFSYTPVPEPSASLIWGLGLGLFAAILRRRGASLRPRSSVQLQ